MLSTDAQSRFRRGGRWLAGVGRGPTLFFLGIVSLVALVSAVHSLHHNRGLWPADTQIYLRMTLEDRGLGETAARDEANRIMKDNAVPSVRGDSRYTSHPPDYYARQFPLFRSRPLYPLAAAALYPTFGAKSLLYIAAASYVLAVMAMFGILLIYARPWVAGLGALALAWAPAVREVAVVGATDSPALLLWILALGVILLYLRRPSNRLLVAVGAAALVLTFTRPAIYLPVGAALGALVAGRADPRARGAALRLLAVTGGVAVSFLIGGALLHGPSVSTQLNWVYDWQHQTGQTGSGFAGWYVRAVVAMFGHAATYDTYENGAILILLLAAFGMAIAWRTEVVSVAIGTALASSVALFVNPVEFVRTVDLPLVPLVILLASFAVTALADAVKSGSASLRPSVRRA